LRQYPMQIDETLVMQLIAEQFPQWSKFPIKAVKLSGHDNRTFHLGKEMLVRLPSAEGYAAQVQKEQKWLPRLMPYLSIQIPEPITMGRPSKYYPWNWSVYHWIDGKSANTPSLVKPNLNEIALGLATFINELHKIDITDGPTAGTHNYYRGGDLSVYDTDTKKVLTKLRRYIDVRKAAVVWEKALSSYWNQQPVWVHGDLSSGNIILKDGHLKAVIDFGCMGIGDPACDLVIAWTFLTTDSRAILKSHLSLDDDTWERARGWALWKALITLVALEDKFSAKALTQKKIIAEVLDEHKNN